MRRTILFPSTMVLLFSMNMILASCSSPTEPVTTQAPLLSNTQPPQPTETQALLPNDTQLPQPTDIESIQSTATQPQVSPTEAQPEIDGETLLNTRCAECHALSKVTSQRKNQSTWNQTVSRMVKKGASLTPEELLILVEYLAQNYGP